MMLKELRSQISQQRLLHRSASRTQQRLCLLLGHVKLSHDELDILLEDLHSGAAAQQAKQPTSKVLVKLCSETQTRPQEATHCALFCSSEAVSADIACHHSLHIPNQSRSSQQQSESRKQPHLLDLLRVDLLLLDDVGDPVQTRLLPFRARHFSSRNSYCPFNPSTWLLVSSARHSPLFRCSMRGE